MTIEDVRPFVRHFLTPAVIGAAALWTGLAGAQTERDDSALPIEITADSLEVLRDQQLATFTGDVDAVQGEMTLSADVLRVYYRDQGEGTALAPEEGAIRRIEASGNVFLTSPGETAEGNEGVYDVASRVVTLEGSVVLTRDDNVIRGDRLVMNLDTGRSRVVAAAPAGEGGAPSERVRAIFVPGSGAEGNDAVPGSGGAGDDAAPDSGPGADAPRPPAPKPMPEGSP